MPAPKGNQNAKGNRGGGRPSKYKPELCEIANRLVQIGLTDEEIGHSFGVCERTINDWKHEHVEFSAAMQLGKDIADERVARALYKSAVGYTKIVKKAISSGKEIKVVEYEEYFPPNAGAAAKWLTVRRREEWAEKNVHEHNHQLGFNQRFLEFLERMNERERDLDPKLVEQQLLIKHEPATSD